MFENAEEMQRIEHQQRLLQKQLELTTYNKRNLEAEETRLRNELLRLENDKYRKLDVMK